MIQPFGYHNPNADASAIVTKWKEFRAPDFKQIKACLDKAHGLESFCVDRSA